VNSRLVKKPGAAVRIGDTLTFVQGDRVRVVTVTGLPVRRGPAEEARTMFTEPDDTPD
jgi:ribosome-associated heat shock protein Hsp15